jgi:acetyltransferase
VIGHAALCDDGESGEVAVFVHQNYRGKKLGKRLLSELIQEANRKGLKRIWGMTELDNVPMLRLAYSLGFMRGEDPREFFLHLPS